MMLFYLAGELKGGTILCLIKKKIRSENCMLLALMEEKKFWKL